MLAISLISSLSANVSSETSKYLDVDLEFLIAHLDNYHGTEIRTSGIVKYLVSIYMFEDFWLCAQGGAGIPIVVRFAGLPRPNQNSLIEIQGVIDFCGLEGGFYYLNASSWSYIGTITVPESPSFLTAPLSVARAL
jgi:hypothetical protein